MATLEIRDLHVSVEDKEILRGVDLTVRAGETHAIMGPNGSGKSTLAYAIAGHPKYDVTGGEVLLDGESVLEMTVDERARAGLFLAMQYPVEVPGVSVSNFLRTAVTAVRGEAPKLRDFAKEMRGAMAELQIDPAFAQRNLNEGFSGGEKKRHEILQLEMLKPKVAVLDETDSGLDIDALKVVSEGVNRFREGGETGVLLITHYTRILRYVKPDFVHVFAAGRDRRGGRLGAGRPAREPRATRSSRRRAHPGEHRRRADPQGLPDPDAHRPRRTAARLPRQRQHLAEAAPGDRRDRGVLRPAQRQHPPGDAPAGRGGDRGVRRRAHQGRRVHRRRGRVRGDLHQEHLRGHQPRRVRHGQRRNRRPGGRAVPARPRRRDRHHRDGAPLQHRAVAAARAAHRRDAPLVRRHRRRPAGPVEHRRAHQRAYEDRRAGPPVERPRHRQPGPRDDRQGPRGRRAGAGRRRAGGAAHAGGRPRARRRLLRLHRAQAVRSDRHRRPVGPP